MSWAGVTRTGGGDTDIGGVAAELFTWIVGVGEDARPRGLNVDSRSESWPILRGALGRGLGRMRGLPISDDSLLRGLEPGLPPGLAADRDSSFAMFPLTIDGGLLGRLLVFPLPAGTLIWIGGVDPGVFGPRAVCGLGAGSGRPTPAFFGAPGPLGILGPITAGLGLPAELGGWIWTELILDFLIIQI